MSLCLACGAANPLDTKFCSQCRTRLLIQDRYRALRIIGQGGFGKTFLAQDEGKPSKPKCVIKQFIYDDPATLREAQRLFEQEAVRLDDLGKHPQIPELLAHCEQEGRQYLVQEFIDGENLLQELNRAGRFSEAKIKELLLDLLPVLQFIHAGQVIHRDIKPENIIRRRSDGRLVVVDFGAAKIASQTALQKMGTTIGSAEYTAPEQARGKAVFASDIYSLGVTCLYLLTQISPFVLFSDLEGTWVWRQFLNGITVSDLLGQILDRAIEQPLGRRFQNATEFLALLQSASVPPPVAKITPQQAQPKVQTNLQPKVQSQVSRQVLGQVSEFEFEYVTTRLNTKTVITQEEVAGRFLGLGKKLVNVEQKQTTVELDRKRGKAQYIREDLGNAVAVDLVRIPAGKFMMGSNQHDSEKPIHEVSLQEFWMGKYAVSQKQWQTVMGNNPSKFRGENLPVEQVSWHEAMNFCALVSQKTGKNFRLPTEAEWEYACRAGTNTPFALGETITTDLVNYDGNSRYGDTPKGEYREKTVDVNSFYPNQWGLYQMHGNVWEWCLDEWHDSYSEKPNELKTNGNQPWGVVDLNKNNRVLRGGSWDHTPGTCRSACRNLPIFSSRIIIYGFRVVLPLL